MVSAPREYFDDSEPEPNQDEHLVSVLRQVWNNISDEYLAGFTARERKRLGVFDLTAACVDYVGLHYGTVEDQRALINLSDGMLEDLGRKAGISAL